MSVLSGGQILSRLRAGDLVISPLVNSRQIGPASVDLRLGNTALLVRGSGLSHVDPRRYLRAANLDEFTREQGMRRKLERVSVEFGKPLILHVNSLILVPTFEWISVPKDLTGVVTARSSWAREGLSIATATFINPCYSGIITLELANLGQIPIALYPGTRLAQIALYTMDDRFAKDCKDAAAGQFNLSFEPSAGDITKADEPFLRGE